MLQASCVYLKQHTNTTNGVKSRFHAFDPRDGLRGYVRARERGVGNGRAGEREGGEGGYAQGP